jgi:predicted enzyme related to lactoylglutathione lyase
MTTSTQNAITDIGQIGITVTKLEAAVQFYRDTLGFNYLFTASGMAFFQLGKIRLMLGQATVSQPRQPASLIYYRVADIDAAYAALRGKGVHFVESPAAVYRADGKELWLAFFNDMDGNVLALMSERTHPT